MHMGDRANIYIKEDEKHGVYLYTHWGGYELPEKLRTALKRGKGRWNDAAYLARIVFCEMVKGDEEGSTGYGISSRLQDNEHPIIVVDTVKQTVTFADEPDLSSEDSSPRENGATRLSMLEYVSLDKADYPEREDK